MSRESKKKPVSIYLSVALKAKVAEAAAKESRTESNMVEHILSLVLEGGNDPVAENTPLLRMIHARMNPITSPLRDALHDRT